MDSVEQEHAPLKEKYVRDQSTANDVFKEETLIDGQGKFSPNVSIDERPLLISAGDRISLVQRSISVICLEDPLKGNANLESELVSLARFDSRHGEKLSISDVSSLVLEKSDTDAEATEVPEEIREFEASGVSDLKEILVFEVHRPNIVGSLEKHPNLQGRRIRHSAGSS